MTDNLTLEERVERYFENKTEMDGYKKLVDEDNKAIKSIMEEQKLDKVVSNDITATRSIIDKTDFDKDKLLSKVKSIWSEHNGSMTNPWVKTVEVVDMEAVEAAIYDGQINPGDLEECKVPKFEVRLTVKRAKKKEA